MFHMNVGLAKKNMVTSAPWIPPTNLSSKAQSYCSPDHLRVTVSGKRLAVCPLRLGSMGVSLRTILHISFVAIILLPSVAKCFCSCKLMFADIWHSFKTAMGWRRVESGMLSEPFRVLSHLQLGSFDPDQRERKDSLLHFSSGSTIDTNKPKRSKHDVTQTDS